MFLCTKNVKAVILFSLMYFDAVVFDDTRNKPKIINYYNSMNGGVDRMDQMLGRYITHRQAAYIVYDENNNDIKEKQSKLNIITPVK